MVLTIEHVGGLGGDENVVQWNDEFSVDRYSSYIGMKKCSGVQGLFICNHCDDIPVDIVEIRLY